MFGKKRQTPQIDKEQLELIKNAQKRIKQKKRLYAHFVIFLLGALFLIIANTVLGIGKDVTFFGKEWFVFAILAWLFLFCYHLFNVFVTHNFIDKDWEDKQLESLVAKQKERIKKLQQQVDKEYPIETVKKIKPKKNTELTIIVAAGENNAIGKDNDLIWHLSDDLKRFKSLTNGHHIIMGRKTFESFPKPLPNRTHIVITRQDNYKVPDGVIVVNNIEDALDAARHDKQPFIIGGGEIYKQSMNLTDKLEITRVHHSFEGADTFFPEIDTAIWKETANTFHDKDEKHVYSFSFLTYERK
ncbi:dihydrofolate reductase [Ichthyenterobacterium magnum]|uniref:dihydrofolate reductase n=1 Tax=Ichthyenterobacterium magnum TaxID=1230530 RepID=A0A420DG24_9FLAO|nr:dihydrofolate reductase [Ichthyenterobacterium magnum]RKE91921.1 dihydrofolate reductase [Ichthyenterobacterium magnum]